MAVLNGTANFNGAGSITQIVGRFWVNAITAAFGAKGQLDSFRVVNRYDYDPGNPRADNMQLRKTRFSQEGFFGDD